MKHPKPKTQRSKSLPPTIEQYHAIRTRRDDRCFFIRQTTANLIGRLVGESMSASALCGHQGSHLKNLRRLRELNTALEQALHKLGR